MQYDAVLLIAFGGPEKMDDVRPFLANVLRGRPVPPTRLQEVVRHYELFDGRSPLNEITFGQAQALQRLFAQEGTQLPVYMGMRNWHPYIAETLEQMGRDGVKNAIGFILSAQQSEAGWERYKTNVEEARERVGLLAPQVSFTPGWHNHPLFIHAVADLTKQAFSSIPADRWGVTPLVYTAHSIPTAIPGSQEYVRQVEEGARLVADRIGHENWTVAYQSRSGPPQVPWLGPDIGLVLKDLASQGPRDAVVVPIGFVCDHIEVLYDLDTEAREIAERNGLHMLRARTVNTHPSFIRMIAEVVRATLNQ
ncbi:MAG: ferrochelatase [Desulfurellaceae bacterium]|nr:ferrochelatase [Desulfurellaceae bacterium]